jgi:hypothetical protein
VKVVMIDEHEVDDEVHYKMVNVEVMIDEILHQIQQIYVMHEQHHL